MGKEKRKAPCRGPKSTTIEPPIRLTEKMADPVNGPIRHDGDTGKDGHHVGHASDLSLAGRLGDIACTASRPRRSA